MGQFNADSLWRVWQGEGISKNERLEALRSLYLEELRQARVDTALQLAQTAYRFALDNNIHIEARLALATLGEIASLQGEYTKSIQILQDVVTQSKANADSSLWAKSLKSIGTVHLKQSNYAAAIEHYEQSLRLVEQQGDLILQAAILNNIGLIFLDLETYDQAVRHLEKANQLTHQSGDVNHRANVLNNLGTVHRRRGDNEQALNYYLQSLQLKKRMGNLYGIGILYSNVGIAYELLQNDAEALVWFEKSYAAHQSSGDQKGQANALIHLGRLQQQSHLDSALLLGHNALTLAQEIGSTEEIADAAGLLFQIYSSQAKEEQALEMFELQRSMRDKMKSLANQKAVLLYQYQQRTNDEQKAGVDSQVEGHIHMPYLWGLWAIIVLVGGGYLYKKYQQLQNSQLELSETVAGLKKKWVAQSLTPMEPLHGSSSLDREAIEHAIDSRLGESAWRILNLIVENPAISNKEIASKVNLSLDGVSSSLRRMYASFAVKGGGNKKIILARRAVEIITNSEPEVAKEE